MCWFPGFSVLPLGLPPATSQSCTAGTAQESCWSAPPSRRRAFGVLAVCGVAWCLGQSVAGDHLAHSTVAVAVAVVVVAVPIAAAAGPPAHRAGRGRVAATTMPGASTPGALLCGRRRLRPQRLPPSSCLSRLVVTRVRRPRQRLPGRGSPLPPPRLCLSYSGGRRP